MSGIWGFIPLNFISLMHASCKGKNIRIERLVYEMERKAWIIN